MNINSLITKYKNSSVTFRATVWYTACNILQKISAFLIIPFLTRLLTTDDYGMYTVFLSWLDIFEIFATMRMYSNGYVAGVIKNESDSRSYTASVQFSSLLTSTLLLFSYHIFSAEISSLVKIEPKLMYMMLLSYYAASGVGIWSAKQRVNNKYRSMTAVTLCYGVLAPLCSIIAAWFATDKLEAAIIVRIAVQLSVALPFILHNLLGKRKKIIWSYCREAFRFNLPLVPYYLSMVLLNSSDRIMIQRLAGESEAAIYGVAYSLSMAIFVFSGALNLALQPWMFRSLKENSDKNRTFTFNVSLVFIAVLNLMVVIAAPELIYITASSEYQQAIWTMPPIASSLLIMFIYQQFLNIHFYFGKNRIVFIASFIAAGTNIALNFVCIRHFGYIAAGYTTLLSYTLIAVLYYFTMKNISAKNNVNYKNYFSMRFIFAVLSAFAVLTVASALLYPYPVIRYAIIGVAVLICIIGRKKLISMFKQSGLI